MLQAGTGDGKKVQLDIEEDGSGMMILLIMLVKIVNYGRSGNGNTSKEKYLEAKKKTRKTVYQAKYKTGMLVSVMWRGKQMGCVQDCKEDGQN